MRVKFWGTRGSIAVPGPSTLLFGGNTPCVEVRPDAGTLLILDCGTGARLLGRALQAEGRRLEGHILLSHTHWDHIQGFPFFAPAFEEDNRFTIYAPRDGATRLEEVLAGQMETPYFPVKLSELGAHIAFRELAEGPFAIDGVCVDTLRLHHPSATMGYRVTAGGASLAYIADHEPYDRRALMGLPEGSAEHPAERRLIDFARGVDLLIMDAMYTEDEYTSKVSWGHGTVDYCTDVAMGAGARRLALFHHEPNHDDATLQRLVEYCRARVEGRAALDVFAAAEGQELALNT